MSQLGTDHCQEGQSADVPKDTDQKHKHSEALTTLKQWRVRISTGGMDEILPGLFVGGLREALNLALMSENGIRAVVSVHGFSRDCHFGPGISLLRLALSDSPGENIMQHFATVNSFVHAHRLKNENVLVHCLAGVSRSVCLCLAYLMTVTNLDCPSALDFVRRRHLGANPNFGFKMQLIKFGQQFVQMERQRLFAEFAHFAGQLNEQFRNDCIVTTNSLYFCGPAEAIFVDSSKEGQQQKQKQRHGNGKEGTKIQYCGSSSELQGSKPLVLNRKQIVASLFSTNNLDLKVEIIYDEF